MRRSLHSLVIAFALATPFAALAAKEAQGPTTDIASIPGGKYVLDTSHASLIFSINHLGFSHYKGRFNSFDATLLYDAAAIEKSAVKVTVNVASVDTNNDTLEAKLISKTFFDTEKYPTASFTSTSFTKLTDTTGALKGNLTLHGTTRPVTLNVTFHGGGLNPYTKAHTLGFSATTTIKRSQFGISEYVPAVGDDVTLTIDAEFGQEQ